jgi:hypothetical protein
MYISKKKVLTKYINKYVTPKYPLIKTINIDTAFVNPKGLLNVDLTIFCYKKDFLNSLSINEMSQSLMIDPRINVISSFFHNQPFFSKNSHFPLSEIRQEIKNYIRTIYNKKLNELNTIIKLEDILRENNESDAKETDT